MYALVPADDRAVEHQLARRRHCRAAREPADVILIRDEAYLHAVRLFRHGQPKLLRDGAGLGLFILPQREDEPRGLLAGEAAEHIALVIGRAALVQRAVFRAGVMAGGDMLRAAALGLGKEILELHIWIADNAGVWGLAAEIAVRERAADLPLQLLLHVDDLEGDTDELRRADGVCKRALPGVVKIHALHLEALLFEERGAHGGIHSAGKAQNYLAHFKLSIYTISTLTSAGDTPEMRLACPKLSGRIFFSFSRASSRSPVTAS